MMAHRCKFGLRGTPVGAAGAVALFLVGATAALAAPPRYPDIMPLSQVKPGMVGYGLTTFKGTTISRFDVRVIGILKNQNAGHDLILIRMHGGPITERGANLIHGMSGSPIYVHGKLIGAFSMGEEFPKEPVGMVTPIEDMLEAWDPDIPQKPDYFAPAKPLGHASDGTHAEAPGAARSAAASARAAEYTLPQPIRLGDRTLKRVVLVASARAPQQSTDAIAVLRPASTLLSVNGITTRDREWLQHELDRRGYNITVASAPLAASDPSGHFRGAPLRPGSAFGTFLSTGDIEFGGTGTVTYRRGNRILGFGHPLMGLGAMEAAVTSAYIIDIFSGLQTSHHIAVAGPVVGTLAQDRNFSVSGLLGRQPRLVPFDVTVRDQTTHRSQTYHSAVFQHPDLTALLLRLIAREAITRAHGIPGDVMASVTTTVDAGEVGQVTRTNEVFDADDISVNAVQDLTDITTIISGNPFYPLPINRARMTVDIKAGHDTATIERIFLPQGRYEPGDKVDIGVVLKPYRREPITQHFRVPIPQDTPTGRYPLLVRGGMASMVRVGPFVLGSGPTDTEAPPVNVRQMVARLGERERNTDLVARLVLNTVAPAIEGEKLSEIPPNLSALMRSDRNSGVRLERDEVRAVAPSSFVVTGTQQLLITVVRKNSQEPAGGSSGSPSAAPGVQIQPFTLPSSGSFTGASEESAPGAVGPAASDSFPQALDLPGAVRSWVRSADGDEPDFGEQSGSPAPTKPKRGRGNKSGQTPAAKSPSAAPPAPAANAGVTSSASATAPAAATPATDSNDKPVVRQPLTWRQAAATDFASGRLEGVSVATDGALQLAPALHRVATTGETYIWSLGADRDGNLYAGTGTSGKILKIDAAGHQTVFATLPVVSVQSLLLDRDGTLWAGSGAKGNLYHITADGKSTLVCTVPEKYIMALAGDSHGNLYLGAGGGGTVYRVSVDHTGAQSPVPYLRTQADHIMALAVDAQDNLYAGTANEGIVYKVTQDGHSSVLFDARENAVTALAVDTAGDVYAGTGPKGVLYRIRPDGSVTTVLDRTTAFFTAGRAAADGRLYFTTVNTVYRVSGPADSEPLVQPLANPTQVDYLALAPLPQGRVAAGTGNVGELFESAANEPQSGMYESAVHDARLTSRWGSVRWQGAVPAGAHVTVQTRSGDVSEPDSSWSPWADVRMRDSQTEEGAILSPPARYLQYRLLLSTSGRPGEGNSPGVREVTVGYLPRNQAPKVSFQSPAGGERWAKSQTIRWSASDPDNDTLTYQLAYSSDNGATWKPLDSQGAPAASKSGAGSSTHDLSDTDVLNQMERDAQSQSAMPPSLKKLIADAARRRRDAGDTEPVLHDTSKTWDTTAVPDGAYRLKVVASDRESNPVDAQSAEAVTDQFIVCNTPPQLTVSAGPTIAADRTVAVQGNVSQTLVDVTAVQYRVDGGDWIAAAPRDGLFDSPHAAFALTTRPLTAGKHTIDIEAFNAAGGKTVQSVSVTVP